MFNRNSSASSESKSTKSADEKEILGEVEIGIPRMLGLRAWWHKRAITKCDRKIEGCDKGIEKLQQLKIELAEKRKKHEDRLAEFRKLGWDDVADSMDDVKQAKQERDAAAAAA